MAHRPPPLLIHLHIPRNAGTTLGRLLRMKLGLWPPSGALHHHRTLGFYRLGDYERRLAAIAALSPAKRRQVRLFEAHAGWGLHERLPQPSVYVTLLREPVDRAVSVYYHLREAGAIPPEMTLEAFVLEGEPRRIWWVDDAQVRYLAGRGGSIVDVKRGRCTRAMLDTACERLGSMALAGITERFDESVLLLGRAMGWRRGCYASANATRGRPPVEELPPSTLDLLRASNQLDLALYDHARRRHEERVAALGAPFREELRRFVAANARCGPWLGRAQKLLAR